MKNIVCELKFYSLQLLATDYKKGQFLLSTLKISEFHTDQITTNLNKSIN